MAVVQLSEKFVPRIINTHSDRFGVLLVGSASARITTACYKDVACPEIDLLLGDHFTGTGRLIQTRNGEMPEVAFSIILGGRKRQILAAAVPLLHGPNIVFPLRFLESQPPAA